MSVVSSSSVSAEKRKRLEVSLNESSDDSVAVRFEQLELDESAAKSTEKVATKAVDSARPAPKRSHVMATASSTSDGDDDDVAPAVAESVDVRELELGFEQVSLAKNAPPTRRPFHMPYIT